MDRKRHQQNKKRSRLQKMKDDKEKHQSQPQNEQLVEEMKASLLHYQDLEKDLASALSKIEEQTAQIEGFCYFTNTKEPQWRKLSIFLSLKFYMKSIIFVA